MSGRRATPMRIAQITSVYLPVPPPSHGGTEWMVHHLCEGLVARGHEVHLFASGDSTAPGRLHAVAERATLLDPEATLYLDKEYEARNAWELRRRAEAGEVDLVHAHWPCLAPYLCDRLTVPVVLSYHYIERSLHEHYREHMPSIRPVCVSRRQAELLGEPDLPVVANGIDLASLPPMGEGSREGLLTVGRIAPNKGIAEAIEVARRAGERLLIVGDTTPYLPWSEAYYREEVAPHVDGDRVRHVRNLANRELLEEMGRARGLVFPLQWEEPFGLVVVEAMAMGTPVLTLRRGAMPELVVDGVTGFLRESPEELVPLVGRLEELSPQACHEHVERHFSKDRMVEGYLALYHELRR